MTREEIYEAMCEAALLPPGSIHGDEALATLPGWDSLAGVDFQRLVAERWEITLDGLLVTEARTVTDLLALFGPALAD